MCWLSTCFGIRTGLAVNQGHQGASRVGFNLTPVTDRLLQATAHPRSCESEFAEPGVWEKEVLFPSCKSRVVFVGLVFLLMAHACSCFPGTRASVPRTAAYLSWLLFADTWLILLSWKATQRKKLGILSDATLNLSMLNMSKKPKLP